MNSTVSGQLRPCLADRLIDGAITTAKAAASHPVIVGVALALALSLLWWPGWVGRAAGF